MANFSAQELELTLPRSVDGSSINQIFIAFNKLNFPQGEFRLLFDFTRTGYLTPCGAVAIAALTDEARERGGQVVFRTLKNSRLAHYAKAVGLIRLAAIERNDYIEAIERYSVQLTRYYTPIEALSAVDLIMKQLVHRTECTQKTEAAIAFMITEIVDNARHGYKKYDDDMSTVRYPHPVAVVRI